MSCIPLGPFDLFEPIGRGGMGEVWRGVHRAQGVPVAIKVLTAKGMRRNFFLVAFRNEIRAMAGLDHPGIALVLDHGEVSEESAALSEGLLMPGSPYLAMELAHGGTLSPWCGRLPWADCREILLGLLDTSGFVPSWACGAWSRALGWIHIGGPAPLRQKAQDRLELIADTFLSVGTPVQLAAPRLLAFQPQAQAAISARLRANLQTLAAAVHDTACQLLPVEGGWYAVLRLPRLLSEEDWALLLLEQDGVLVHPGYFYDFAQEAYVVLSLLTEPAVLKQGAERLVARVAAS